MIKLKKSDKEVSTVSTSQLYLVRKNAEKLSGLLIGYHYPEPNSTVAKVLMHTHFSLFLKKMVETCTALGAGEVGMICKYFKVPPLLVLLM